MAVSAVPYIYRTDQSDSYSCQSVARKTTYVSEEINLAVSNVKLLEHCYDGSVMQIVYYQNRSVWQQQCQSIVTLAMSSSQYNRAALY